ncbi:MAG: hypothetical protein V7K32_03160 [Nostoc sp.]
MKLWDGNVRLIQDFLENLWQNLRVISSFGLLTRRRNHYPLKILSQRFLVAGAAGVLRGVLGILAVCPYSPPQAAIAPLVFAIARIKTELRMNFITY